MGERLRAGSGMCTRRAAKSLDKRIRTAGRRGNSKALFNNAASIHTHSPVPSAKQSWSPRQLQGALRKRLTKIDVGNKKAAEKKKKKKKKSGGKKKGAKKKKKKKKK